MPIDPRIVRVGIEINGNINYYEGLNIEASGTKFANATENECEVKITNLSKQMRDYLLLETSPFLKPHYEKTPPKPVSPAKASDTTPKAAKEPTADGAAEVVSGIRLFLEVGRESTGTAVLFVGDIIRATVSQPPDIDISIKAITKSQSKGDIVSVSHGEQTSLKTISEGIAKSLGLSLLFEAQDKKISNYSFTGGKLKQVEEIGRAGNVNAYVDDDKLVVKSNDAYLKGKTQTLNMETGMIGLPELTEHGIKVKYLYNNESEIGGALIVESKINPAVNGTYIIYKLSFDVANRQNPFYLTAEAKRV